MLITRGKTNWQFLLIIITLTIIAGGGIFWFTSNSKLLETAIENKTTNENSKSIRDIDFVKYLADIKYPNGLNPAEFCMPNQEPIYIDEIKYADLDNDSKEEAIVIASTCFTGTAGPDINSIYKLSPSGEIIELKLNNDFQGKNVFDFDDYAGKSYRLDFEDGKLFDVLLIRKEGDPYCCPAGGTKQVFYKWNGEEFIVTDVVIKKNETADWKIYRNEEYGFEVKYPADWKPIEIEYYKYKGSNITGKGLYRFETPTGEVEFPVNLIQYKYEGSLEEFFVEEKDKLAEAEGANYILSEKKEIEVGGERGIEIPNRIGNNYESALIFVKKYSYIYRISLPVKTPGDPLFNLAPIDESISDTLNQMLSTFRFLK